MQNLLIPKQQADALAFLTSPTIATSGLPCCTPLDTWQLSEASDNSLLQIAAFFALTAVSSPLLVCPGLRPSFNVTGFGEFSGKKVLGCSFPSPWSMPCY